LLPKSTGLFLVADALTKEMDYIYDLTVGYGGLEKLDIPYEEYLIDNVFFSKYYPKEVHINVRRFKISEIPGMREKSTPPLVIDKNNRFDPVSEQRRSIFSDWMINKYMEKDELMKTFYEKGKFEENQVKWAPYPSLNDIILIGVLLGSSLVLVPLLCRILLFGLVLVLTIIKNTISLVI
jgi:hypothetical protein